MKTITLHEPGRLALSETDAPTHVPLAPNDVLVRVHAVGICGTDLHAYKGRQPFFSYPRILGHELGVEVVTVGPNVQNVQPGDTCAVEPYLNCGVCIACRRGKTNCCVRLQVLGVHTDGGMREFITVPAAKLHPSKVLPLETLALVETLGIGAHAVSRAQIEPGENVLVIGAGPIGLSVVPFVQAQGARVFVKDVNASRLDFCRAQFGVTHTLNGDADETLATLLDLTNGDLPTVVFDATGNPASMAEAFDYIAPGGRLVFVGLFLGDVSFHDPDFHKREITLLASRNSVAGDFTRIISLLEAGTVDPTPWITHRLPASDLADTFEQFYKPETGLLKAIVSF